MALFKTLGKAFANITTTGSNTVGGNGINEDINYINALAYARMGNTVQDADILQDFYSNLKNKPTTTAIDDLYNKLDEILDNTTIKRACCLRKGNENKYVDVRIPLPTGATNDSTLASGRTAQKYKYYDIRIPITNELCKKYAPQYKSGTSYCDDFYKVYCNNIIQSYKKDNNGKFDFGEFSVYKPECLCYTPLPSSVKDYGVAPQCFIPNCADNSTNVYLDSRWRGKGCDLTICQASINLNDLSAGGNADIASNIQQKCGTGAQNGTDPGTTDPTTTDPGTTDPTNPTDPTDPGTTDPTTTTDQQTFFDKNKFLIFGGIGGVVLLCCCVIIIVIALVFLL